MLILSQGLLINLVVVEHLTKKGKATDKFEVVAGGRRRRALMRLAELGKIASDAPVLCKLTTMDKALAASVAKNSAREPMSKPDTIQAFAALAANGESAEDISVSFGITPMTVMRRLKLANVSPKLFDLYRAEEISTEQMMALAIVDDHEVQERVWGGASRYDRHPKICDACCWAGKSRQPVIPKRSMLASRRTRRPVAGSFAISSMRTRMRATSATPSCCTSWRPRSSRQKLTSSWLRAGNGRKPGRRSTSAIETSSPWPH